MVEYVSYENLSKGIKMKNEVCRSDGWGWVLCSTDKAFQLHFIHGGYMFQEDSLLLSSEETQSFREKGSEYLDQLFQDILKNTKAYAPRFLEKQPPEYISITQIAAHEDGRRNLGVCYTYQDEPFTGSVHDSVEGTVRQEWVLKKGEIVQYIRYGSDGRSESILDGPECLLVPEGQEER
ncbi:MAG: hypothetical protein PQJ58_06760 [Spirochaetales bacterium]|nr:hypothetical protein [Spirochaetales bacterium]